MLKIVQSFNKLIGKINIRLPFKLDSRLLTFLFFTCIATILWFLSNLGKYYVVDIPVNVFYTNIPENRILVKPLPSQFNLKLKTSGFNIVKYKIKRDFLKLNIDLNRIPFITATDSLQGYVRLDNMKNDIASQLDKTTELIQIRPDTLFFVYAIRAYRKVPVKILSNITLKKQYIITGKIQIEPDSVLVSGQHAVIDTLSGVWVNTIQAVDLDKETVLESEIVKNHAYNCAQTKVKVTIPVELYTEKQIEKEIEILNIPPNLTVKVFPHKTLLTYRVALSNYQKITPDLFYLVVDYDEIKTSINNLVKVQLLKLPDNVYSFTLNPAYVEFIIESK